MDKPALSRARNERARKHARKHARKDRPLSGVNLLMAFVLWVLLVLSIHLARTPEFNALTPGQRASSTVQALVDFESYDLAATALARERAAAGVPPVFTADESALNEHLRVWAKLVARHQALHTRYLGVSNATERLHAEFADVVDLMGLPHPLQQMINAFTPDELRELTPVFETAVKAAWASGIVSADDRESGFQGTASSGRISLLPSDKTVSLHDLALPGDAVLRVLARVKAKVPLGPEQSQMLNALLTGWMAPNLLLNREQTELRRQEAVRSVQPVPVFIRERTTLMEARTRVTEQMIQDLRAHQNKLNEVEDGHTSLMRLIGDAMILAVVVLIAFSLYYLLRPATLSSSRTLLLYLVLVEGSMLLTRLLGYLSSEFHLFASHMLVPLLPHAVAPLLGTILIGPVFGLVVGFTVSMGAAVLHDLSIGVFVMGFGVTMAATIGVRAIHKRSNLFRAGVLIGSVQAVMVIAMGILSELTPVFLLQQALGAFLSGVLASVLVFLLVPPFEYLFKVTTDIRLLELSDMGHPLLRRLAMEAPGTYHHSLMVAHLAQTAAREIGAKELQVRVCAYYHDIGKLTKPEFFVENQQGGSNPHDELTPSMSRLVIISHVKEGVSLAHRHKLPSVLVEGIEQHHGTSVIQYFYHRACQQEEGKTDKSKRVRLEDYRYPGPKPRSREMGILLIADSLEAASRTLDRNKPSQLEGLVNSIIDEKLSDGQFDESGLTLTEIATIRRVMIFSLNNMLHGRIAYPPDENRDQQPAAAPAE